MIDDSLRNIHQRMKGVADLARLPLRSGQWSGVTGSVLGMGSGSSIDFQDQRPYLPGDDPRHINWQAYARTGHYTMKLYREEVSPRVDFLLDLTPSMFLTSAKRERTWEVVYFCLESALRLGASIKLYTIGVEVRETPLHQALAYDWALDAAEPSALPSLLTRIPLRTASLRLLISDLLFSSTPPEVVLPYLATGKGRPIVLAPFCPEEANPAWEGNVDFEECESGFRQKRRVEKPILQRYLKAYQTHFTLWRDQCRRYHAPMARVSSEGDFLAALRAEALEARCVEIG